MRSERRQRRTGAATMGALIAEQFPQWAGLPLHELATTGTVNRLFRLGGDLVVRVRLEGDEPTLTRQELEREQRAADEFDAATDVESSVMLAIGAPGHGCRLPWSVHNWIGGEPVTESDHADAALLASDLAALLVQLRAVPTGGRTFGGNGRGGALTCHDAWIAECLERSAGLLDLGALGALWQRMRVLGRTAPDAMCHGDLIPFNLIADGGHLTGVLDCGGFGPADPALDLVCAWHLFDGDQRAVLRSSVGADDLEWARGQAWAFAQAIGLVWYYRRSNPSMARLGERSLGRILADPAV